MPLLSEWLGHAQMETTIKYYANADIRMKQEAIEKATSDLNPILSSQIDFTFKEALWFDVKDYPDFFDIFSQKNGVFCQNSR